MRGSSGPTQYLWLLFAAEDRQAFEQALIQARQRAQSQAEQLQEGEQVQLGIQDAGQPWLQRADGTRLPCEPVPDFLMQRVRCGGLLNELKQRLAPHSHD